MRARAGRAAVAVVACALATAAASCGPRDVQEVSALPGRWEGRVAWRDATTPLVVTLRREGDSLVARVAAPALAPDSAEAGAVAFAPPRVRFAWPDSAGAIVFDGWLRRGLIVGSLSGAATGGETNRALQPQFALKRHEGRAHALPWPDSLTAPAPVPHEPGGSLGGWLRRHAGR